MSRSKIVIFASSRAKGDTWNLAERVFSDIDHEFVDLANLSFSEFDYEHKNCDDDFLPLMEKIATFDDIIIVSPVYWYAICARMKVFFDRWSDLLTIRKDLGNRLSGKNMFAVASYGTRFPPGDAYFLRPLEMTCDYMNMHFRGSLCVLTEDREEKIATDIQKFREQLLSEIDEPLLIEEGGIGLRLATLGDRKNLHKWMYESDAASSMFGSPLYPEKPLKSWEEFKGSWEPWYFQKPLSSRGHVFVICRDGIEAGGIAFHQPDQKNRSEIDIWLRSEADCGKGTGSNAIRLLCDLLYRQFGIMFFWVMPSARNPRSVATFRKVGFKPLPVTPEEGKLEFGFQDYRDSIYLLRDMSLT